MYIKMRLCVHVTSNARQTFHELSTLDETYDVESVHIQTYACQKAGNNSTSSYQQACAYMGIIYQEQYLHSTKVHSSICQYVRSSIHTCIYSAVRPSIHAHMHS